MDFHRSHPSLRGEKPDPDENTAYQHDFSIFQTLSIDKLKSQSPIWVNIHYTIRPRGVSYPAEQRAEIQEGSSAK